MNLTIFQIHVLLGHSHCDEKACLKYEEFAKTSVKYIDENYRFEIMANNCRNEQINNQSMSSKAGKYEHPSVVELDEIELFRTFKRYDRNINGHLEFPEYI